VLLLQATFIYNNWLSKSDAPYQISAQLTPLDAAAQVLNCHRLTLTPPFP
jgi:hypothetical protein